MTRTNNCSQIVVPSGAVWCVACWEDDPSMRMPGQVHGKYRALSTDPLEYSTEKNNVVPVQGWKGLSSYCIFVYIRKNPSYCCLGFGPSIKQRFTIQIRLHDWFCKTGRFPSLYYTNYKITWDSLSLRIIMELSFCLFIQINSYFPKLLAEFTSLV